ncbi:hypothetical protein [Nitrosomonas marina]|uniref:Peptidase propeptide and YPEB domain-containing protein n=1 Tax=Nitrosomonas marina TaxID=917 RepID=A0A1H8F738_9PROT|nr:hypothetical protein [Nitrosomonas marina]SEN27306.1 hypothetical protein SAMN05216325_11219 [Nitrosomonas marina]
MKISVFVLVSVAILFFSSNGSASLFSEEKIEWPKVPARVQHTIASHLHGGKIEEIEKKSKKKTITVYEAKITKPDGDQVEIKVEEDGTLVEFEDD